MIHLRSFDFTAPESADGYPFAVPALRKPESLEFHAPVTFFTGENGSGKSALLEELAIASERATVSRQAVARDPPSMTCARWWTRWV